MQPAPQERIDALWRAAQRLQRRASHANALPPLWFFTDPARTAEPERIIERLPTGCGVVYRAFGALDAATRGRTLTAISRERGLLLLVGADASLALRIGADGVHLPEHCMHRARALRARRSDWVVTSAMHSRSALAAAERQPLTAAFASPVFPSRSPSAGAPIGPVGLRRFVRSSSLPIIALGGVDAATIAEISHTGAAGVAAVDAFLAG